MGPRWFEYTPTTEVLACDLPGGYEFPTAAPSLSALSSADQCQLTIFLRCQSVACSYA